MEAQLLRQWRAGRFQDRLLNLPVNLLLRDQLRQLQKEKLDADEKTGCLPIHRRLRRLIWKRIVHRSKRSVQLLNLQPCLLCLRLVRIQTQRRLLLALLVFLVRCLRKAVRSRGTPPASGRCSRS